jgi:cytoskeletal protein CcmA (bactofilin family)
VEGDEAVIIGPGEVVAENLYAFGQDVTIEGTIQGDLVAAGGRIEVMAGGVVEGDLLAAGREIVVTGEVAGDIRSAGFVVHVAEGGAVGGELVAAAWGVEVEKGATVSGDALLAGYQGIADGELGQDLDFAGAGLSIAGHVAGDVSAAVGGPNDQGPPPQMFMMGQPVDMPPPVAPGLAVADSAAIDGNLEYSAPRRSDVDDAGVGGEVRFTEVAPSGAAVAETNPATDWVLHFVKTYLALLIVGLLALVILPRLVPVAATVAGQQSAAAAGWGLLGVAVAFFGAIVTTVGLIAVSVFLGALRLDTLLPPLWSAGIVTVILLTFGMWLFGWLGWVVVGLLLGRALLRRPGEGEVGLADRLPALLIGGAILALLFTLPIVGGLFKLAVGMIGIGAVVLAVRTRSTTSAFEGATPATT